MIIDNSENTEQLHKE